MKRIIFLLPLFFISNALFAQYKIQTVHRPDGITLNYFNPVPVVRTVDYEVGLSLYKNASEEIYVVSLFVLFKNTIAQELTGNLIIQTTGKNGISLVPVMHKIVSMNGENVGVSMYSLTTRDIKELKTNPIKMIVINIGEEIIGLHLTENKDVFIKGFSSLKEISSNTNPKDPPPIKSEKTVADRVMEKMNEPNEYTDLARAYSNNVYYGTDLGDSKDDAEFNISDPQDSINEHRAQSQPRIVETESFDNYLIFILGIIIFFLFVYIVLENKKGNYKSQINKANNVLADMEKEIKVTKENNSKKENINSKPLVKAINTSVQINPKPKIVPQAIVDLMQKRYVDFIIPDFIKEQEGHYPIIKFPQQGCIIRSYKSEIASRRGITELGFQDQLKVYFSEKFEVTEMVVFNTGNNTRPYRPDIAFIEKEGNIRIDIEIDEPYAGYSRQAIHCKGDDFLRDCFFTDRGWIVIRFSEYQVYNNPLGCIVYISNVLESIKSEFKDISKLINAPELNFEKQWDLLQAQKWEKEKYREFYLNYTFGFEPEHIATKQTGLTLNEIEEEKEVVKSYNHPTQKIEYERYNAENIQKRDSRIIFYPFEHKYEIDQVEAYSVSQVVCKFFTQFNADEVIFKMMNGAYWNPEHKYWNMSASEIKRMWDDSAKEARDKGSQLHSSIESYFLKKPYTESIEFKQFLSFINNYKMQPFRTEWRIFNEDYNIAGTVDFITQNADGTFDIYDWKRSSKIIDLNGSVIKNNMYGKCGIGILNNIDDTSYNQYCIQQNLYKYILESKYNVQVRNMYLVVLHEDYANYTLVPVNHYQECINGILETLL